MRISELLLIQGITPDIYWGPNSTNHPPAAYQQQQPGFDHTPHSSKSRFKNEASDVPNPVGMVELFSPFGAKLNINTASAKTLQLLPGINADTAQRIVEQRAGPDGIDGTEDDAPFHNVLELNSGLPGGGSCRHAGVGRRCRREWPGHAAAGSEAGRHSRSAAGRHRGGRIGGLIATCAAMSSRCMWRRKSTVSSATLSASSAAAAKTPASSIVSVSIRRNEEIAVK